MRGDMYPLRADDDEVSDFNRWLTYRLSQGQRTTMLKVDPQRFPTHYSGKGPIVAVSPEFKALLDRNNISVLK